MTLHRPDAASVLQRPLLRQQLHASPRTIASYRDSSACCCASPATDRHRAAASSSWDDLDEPLIAAFLEHLETERYNSARTRNLRLTDDPLPVPLRRAAPPRTRRG